MDDTDESASGNQPSTSEVVNDTNNNDPSTSEDPDGTKEQSKEPQDEEDVKSVKSKSPSPDIKSFDDVSWRDPASPVKSIDHSNEKEPETPSSETNKSEEKQKERQSNSWDSTEATNSIPPELKYEAMKSALDEKISCLPEVAAKTLFRYLDIHKPRQSEDVKKRGNLTPEFIETVSSQAKELEKQIKTTSRRITESKREQIHLAEQIENLKNKFIKDQEVTLITELLDKVPSSRDLKRIQKLNEISLEWKQQQRNIEKVQIKMDALNKVMANLDVIIQESGAVNKKRRVIFSTDLKGRVDAQTSPSPPPWQGFKEGFVNENQIIATADDTNGKANEVTKDDKSDTDGQPQGSDEDEDNLLSNKNGSPEI